MTSPYDFGNDILYKMCRDKPLHNEIPVTLGKIWLIGRAYSASLERKAGKDYNKLDAAEKINNSNIDKWIQSISNIEHIDSTNINYLLDTHKNLTNLFHQITGLEKRSLASKYLHFHAPKAVFIYDSIANRTIRERLNGIRFKKINGFDDPYSDFVIRCLHLRNMLSEENNGQLANPREIDKILLNY